MYDATIELVVPEYARLHEVVLRLVVDHLEEELGAGARETFDGWLLELGAGTGKQALALLRALPRARLVAVDGNERMQRALHRKLARRAGLVERCTQLAGDLRGPVLGADALLAPLRAAPRRRRRPAAVPGYHAVVAVLVLSSLEREEKLEVLRRVHQVLRPGGALVIGDLFAFRSPSLNGLALALELDRMRALLARPGREHASARAIPPAARRELGELWRRYYLERDRAEPIEGAAADAPSPSPGHVELLRAAGFREIELPFRCWRVGVIWARK